MEILISGAPQNKSRVFSSREHNSRELNSAKLEFVKKVIHKRFLFNYSAKSGIFTRISAWLTISYYFWIRNGAIIWLLTSGITPGGIAVEQLKWKEGDFKSKFKTLL